MFTEELKNIIEQTQNQAVNEGFKYLRPEHLLLGIINVNEEIKVIFNKNDISIKKLEILLLNYLREQLNKDFDSNKKIFEHSSAYKTVIDRARFQSIARKNRNETLQINCLEIVLAIFTEDSLFAFKALEQVGLKRYMLTSFMNEGKEEPEFEGDSNNEDFNSENIITDLTKLAKQKKLDPLIGRKEELKRLEHILSRKKKNNPILVGEPGVGKTVIVEGLAQDIVNGMVDDDLLDYRVLSLNVNGLVAGTKYRGEFESRIQNVINKIKNEKVFLFIDEIHMILGAGAASSGSDLANILKPYLTNRDVVCIGATTVSEYRQIFEKNSALARRFNKIDVEPLSEEDSFKVIKELIGSYEKHHKVKYSKESLMESIKLSQRYITNKQLPDKALDVIDEAGAFVKLTGENREVVKEDIENVISRMTKIPVKNIVAENEKETLSSLSNDLNGVVFGQENAIENIVDAIVMNKAGIKKKDKPIGSFLFLGSTGVGKTELCKQLSYAMNMELIRFDMSEYMEKHTVSKLIGAPAGYVGYEKGGLLTEKINANPYSILLLDEVEKAHPDVLNIMLQMMDYGFLTDSEGRKVDCRNTLIIMTSNCGVKKTSLEKNSIGFVQDETKSYIDYNIVNMTFSPEFRNRLTEIVEFNPLTEKMMKNIVKRALTELQVNLDEKDITLKVSEGVISYLAENGYDPEMGARPINKIVEKEVSKPISKMIVFENLEAGDEIKVKIKNKKLDFSTTKSKNEMKEKV